jgi:hypothetical protein
MVFVATDGSVEKFYAIIAIVVVFEDGSALYSAHNYMVQRT